MSQEMLYKIGLWLVKLLKDTNADEINYKLKGVTDDKGKEMGDFELRFTPTPHSEEKDN